uniref:Phlebovirus_G2 domain-containing protein n=1 Tax=Meloidogyne hapla TaxID=6305 RepID=A0A1I8BJB5_MELHA
MEAEGDEYKKEKKESKKLENGQNIEENKNENKNKGQEQKSKNDLKQIKDGKNKLIKNNNKPTHPMVTRSKKALIMTIINLFVLIKFVASNPTYLVSCKGCRMKCQSFGIQINVGPEINKVEICCMSTCIIETNGLEHLELELPKDVTALNYKCRAKYMNGRRIFRGNIFCPAVDPCLRIKEIWERILNPQCESTKSMVIVGIFLGLLFCLLISGMFCAFKVFSILSSIFSIIWKIIKAMFKLSSKKDEKVKSKESESLIDCSQKLKKIKRIKRNRRLNRLGLLNIMVLIIFVEIVRADIEVISVQAKSEDCYRSKNITTCKITTSNTLTLLPDGQVISLTLKNDKGMIMGEMEFIMNSLSIKCNQKSQRQLRSYELKVGSVKRCPAQGTCKAGACQHIRSKENVEELLEWSGKPGNSYCVEGHALWGYQCGLPGAACYFYKVYAEPKSSEIYELVTCPTWDYVIDMEVSMRFKGNISKYGFSINPGMTVKWDKIKISLMDITPPIAPILSSQFIMGNNGVAMVDNFKTDLECEDASNFSKCELDINACKECWLNKEEEQIKCACMDLIIEDIFKDKQRSLPIDTKRIKLRNYGKNIYSETSYLPIEIMVRFENYSISSNIDISICKIEQITLSGCYNCFGAFFKFKCFSDYGSPLAEIKCKNGNTFTGKCSINGTEQVSVLSFDRTEVKETCEVLCPGGTTKFTLHGTLEYILPEKAKIVIKNGTPSLYTMESNWGGIFENSLLNFKLLDMQGVEDVYGRLYFNRLERSKVANEARKVENKNGNIYCSTNEFSSPRGVITGLSEWILVDDNEKEDEYPEQIPYQWWMELIEQNRIKTQKFFLDEEVNKRIGMGPGLVLDNPLRGVLEFYPLEGLEIEEFNEGEVPDKINSNININNNNIQIDYGSQSGSQVPVRAITEITVSEGDLKNIKIDFIEGEKVLVTMEAKPDLHCSSSGSEISTVEIKVRAKLFKGPMLATLFCVLLMGMRIPAMAAPTGNSPITPQGDPNIEAEDPVKFEQLCDAYLGPRNSSLPQGEGFVGLTLANGPSQGRANTNSMEQMRSVFDELMDNWATRNLPTSTTTTAVTTQPFIQFVPAQLQHTPRS